MKLLASWWKTCWYYQCSISSFGKTEDQRNAYETQDIFDIAKNSSRMVLNYNYPGWRYKFLLRFFMMLKNISFFFCIFL